MADTLYTNGVTVIQADTMNDLNRLHYTIFQDPAGPDGIIARLPVATALANGVMSTAQATRLAGLNASNLAFTPQGGITSITIEGAILEAAQSGSGGGGSTVRTVREETSDFELDGDDDNAYIRCNAVVNININIAAIPDGDYPIGASTEIELANLGGITFSVDASQTVNMPAGTEGLAQFSVVVVTKTGSNQWNISTGGLTTTTLTRFRRTSIHGLTGFIA